MRSAVVLALCVVVVLTADSAAGKTNQVCGRPAVAHLLQAITPDLTIDDVPTTGRPALASCDDIYTTTGGLHFKIDKFGVDCQVMPGSEAEVEPTKKQLVAFDLGRSKCSTLRKYTNHTFRAGGTIMKGDPLFSVTVRRRGRVSIHVARGFIEAGPKNVIIGPRQQSLATGARVQPAKALPGAAVASLTGSSVASVLPKLEFSRPPAGRSQTLARIFKRDRLVVGLAGGKTTGIGSQRFVRAYFRFLTRRWRLRLKIAAIGAGRQPARSLASRAIDVLVTPQPPKRTQTERLFFDRAGMRWSMTTAPDPVFFASLDRFLKNALETGAYGVRYDIAFTRPSPAYGLLRPLILPKIGCTPQPGADLTSPYNLSLALVSRPAGPFGTGLSVTRTATVTNHGARNLDCVAIHFDLFSAALVGPPRLEPASNCHPDETLEKLQAGELRITCEVGPVAAGAAASVRLIGTPTASAPVAPPLICATTDAAESAGVPEAYLGDNGQCAQIVYRNQPLIVGAADDTMKGSTVGGARSRLALLTRAGLDAAVITDNWIPGQSAPTPDQVAELSATAAAAREAGIQLFLEVTNAVPTDAPRDPVARRQFADFAAALAESASELQYVIVGNEPNNGRFWAPQYDESGAYLAASDYEALLAQTYDALKAVPREPAVTVIGGALAPRGIDVKPQKGRETRSPTAFIGDLGAAYRDDVQRGRRAPIMDAFALHPFTERPDIPPSQTHPPPSKQLGIADYPRLVSLLGSAFDGSGTKQKGSELPIYYTEYGVETFVPPGKGPYEGKQRTPRTATENQQGAFYEDAIDLASCQPTVAGLFLFHAVDDKEFARWQSGIYYLNGTAKGGLSTVRKASLAAEATTLSSCAAVAR